MENPQPQSSQQIQPKSKLDDALAKIGEAPPTVAAKSPGAVLPLSFYQGASLLVLSSEEKEKLAAFAVAPDDDVEIRPDGLAYLEHMYYRRALTSVFGPGEWALLPATDAKIVTSGDRALVVQEWVLAVRGKFVGQAEGSGAYYPNNPKQDQTDAIEAAQSNAIARICAKSSLGIGTNPWSRAFRREWRKRYAVKVWVKTPRGNAVQWRRRDDEEFEGELGEVKEEKRPESSVAPIAPKPTRPPEPPPGPSQSQPQPPAAPGAQMTADGNWRLCVATARRANLIGVGGDAKDLLYALCEALEMSPPEMPGKSTIEICHAIVLALTLERFSRVVMPMLREKVKRVAEVKP